MKRILCLLVFTCALFLPGCGEEQEENISYKLSDWTALPESVRSVRRILPEGEDFLLCCQEEEQSYAARIQGDGSGFEKLPLPPESGEKLLDLAPDGQGGLWCLCEKTQGEAEALYTLRRVDSSFRTREEIPLNAMLEREDALHAYAEMTLKADAAGNLCLLVNYGRAWCFFLDNSGGFLFSLQSEGTPQTLITTGNGEFALCLREGLRYALLRVDMDRQNWGEKTALSHVNTLFDGSGDVDYYLYDSAALYEQGAGEKKKLFDWAGLGLASGDAHVCPLGEGRFSVVAGSFSQTGLSSYEFCVAEPGEDTRTVLSMLSFYPDNGILDAVAHFNKSDPQYRVELRSVFASGEQVSDADWNNAMLKLNTEIIAGKAPDILDLHYLPAGAFLRQGILEDLYPWLEKDASIDQRDYFANVFQAMSIDGKLPYVCSDVMVLTMFADSRLLGEKPGWTLDEFAAFQSSSPHAVESVSAGWFLERLLRGVNRFVDRESASCYFDSPEFIALLGLAKSVEKASTEGEGGAACYFVNAGSVFDVARFRAQLGGEALAIGYPGSGKVSHVLSPSNRIGISSTGAHKEGAWAFARSFLEPRQQESGGFFPIRMESFEKIARAAQEGRSMWAQLYPGEITEADIALSRRILREACYSLDSTDELTELILSGAEPYFQGAKTAEQVAADIQKRAAIYINEQK